MAKAHRMTPARKAALRKAQAASARKRRGKGKGKLAAANRTISRRRRRGAIKSAALLGASAAIVGAAAYHAHKQHKAYKRSVAKSHATTQANLRDFAHAANRMQHHNFGLTRRQMAKGKAASAARGTSGSHKRKFVSHPPPKKAQYGKSHHRPVRDPVTGHTKKEAYRIQSRERQLRKAGDVARARAGLHHDPSAHTRTFVSGRRRHTTRVRYH